MLRAERRNYPELDRTWIDRLLGTLGRAAVREMLSDGMLELTERISRIEELAHTGERAAIARFAHDVVGTAGQLGLARLSVAAVELEHVARETDAPLEPRIAALARVSAPALAALQRCIDGLASV